VKFFFKVVPLRVDGHLVIDETIVLLFLRLQCILGGLVGIQLNLESVAESSVCVFFEGLVVHLLEAFHKVEDGGVVLLLALDARLGVVRVDLCALCLQHLLSIFFLLDTVDPVVVDKESCVQQLLFAEVGFSHSYQFGNALSQHVKMSKRTLRLNIFIF